MIESDVGRLAMNQKQIGFSGGMATNSKGQNHAISAEENLILM